MRARVGVVEESSISASRPVSMAWASSTSCSGGEQGVRPELAEVATGQVDRALALLRTVAPGHRILFLQERLDLRARSLIDGNRRFLKARGWSTLPVEAPGPTGRSDSSPQFIDS